MWALVGVGAMTAGCATHEAGFDEPIKMPATFVATASDEGGVRVPDEWWRAFEDERLNELVAIALDDNFDLASFRDRLRAARAIVERERSALFPSVDYSLFLEETRRESVSTFDGEPRAGASVIGTYEVDVWGRIRAGIDAASFERAVAREQLRAAAIALSADVALTWYALVEQRGQANVLEEQIRTNEQVLRVVRTRFGAGVVRASDVLRQERLLESTREQIAVVRADIEVLEHALLVLIGRSPTLELGAPGDELPALPPAPALGLPSELVQRRPDVRSAFFSIEAADSFVARAVADQYPSITLAFDAGTIEDQVADLFDDWSSTISVDVLGPLFDAGQRRAEVERAEAVKAERVSVYAQTILVAFRQVVDAIARESGRVEQIRRIERQLELAQRTSERLNREYLNGDISYIDVLDALTTQQRLQRDLLSARRNILTDRIDLYRALAGGWEGVVPPSNNVSTTTTTTTAERG